MSRRSSKKRRVAPKTALRLPDLDQPKSAVLNSLTSGVSLFQPLTRVGQSPNRYLRKARIVEGKLRKFEANCCSGQTQNGWLESRFASFDGIAGKQRLAQERLPAKSPSNEAIRSFEELMMNTHQILLTLSVTNTALLAFLATQPHRTAAQEVAPVVRGRAFEIVDDHGRVRAEIKVFPRDPAVKMPDGTTGYPETVLLRLIDSKGGPHVKIAATEDGSGISLGGESNPTDIQILARGANTSLKLTNKDGKQQLLKP